MSRTLFIADLHLSQDQPNIIANFVHFLKNETKNCDALYILGDLFEVWIGDDDIQPFHQQISDALLALTCPIFFIHGNRDFLLGSSWASNHNVILLPEEAVITLYGKKLLIMHGDTLCTDDIAYQKYRRRINQRWLQKLFLALPITLRRKIADKMRFKSSQANRRKEKAIMDVNLFAVKNRMEVHQVTTLIHGHTHRPAIHTIDTARGILQRAVLGDWHRQGSIIIVDNAGLRLEKIKTKS